jgi:hypothetical protein
VNTVAAWIKEHPGVNVLAFERNSDKSIGFGKREEVCGYCLASHYFEGKPPSCCRFCRAPLRETHLISDFSEIVNRIYTLPLFHPAVKPAQRKLLFIVKKRTELDS